MLQFLHGEIQMYKIYVKLKSGMCTLITSELFDLEFYTEEQRGNIKKSLCLKHYEGHGKSLKQLQTT